MSRNVLHKKIDRRFGVTTVLSEFNTLAIDDERINWLKHAILKFEMLSKLRQNLIRVPDEEWKPGAFR